MLRTCCVVIVVLGMVLSDAEVRSGGGWKPILPPGVSSYDSRFGSIGEDSNFGSVGESHLTERDSIHSPLDNSPFGQAPIHGQFQNEESDHCTLYKVSFNQQLYFQYIQYKIGIPDMKEFTLCMWNKFTNHSNDHPLFSYSLPNQPRAILSWVSNTKRASYYSLSVEGHTFYRLNYPLRLNRWYHSCQSWNSHTGEWQIWINAERVGRGFHNRLVGHVIPGGGVAITGQEQRQQGGGFLEGAHAPQGAGGLLGEVTMLHLYHAALAPGKAHKDHKHHHGQHSEHTTTPSPAPTTPAPPPGFLVGNQLPHAPILNLGNLHLQRPLLPAGATPSPTLNPIGILAARDPIAAQQFAAQQQLQQLQQQFGASQQQQPQQFGPPQQQQQPQQFGPPQQQQQQQQQQQFGFSNLPSGLQLTGQGGGLVQQSFQSSSSGLNLNIGGFDGGNVIAPRGQRIFKREDDKKNVTKRSTEEVLTKEMLKTAAKDDDKKTQKKRGVFFEQDFGTNLGSLGGFGTTGQNLNLLDLEGPQNTLVNAPAAGPPAKDDGYPREPAEGEVIQIMNVCSGCAIEPFKKAEIISWRNTPKKLYSGALFLPARPQCRKF